MSVCLMSESVQQKKNAGQLKKTYKPTSTGFRQNIGTPTGRLGNFFGLFPLRVSTGTIFQT